MVKNAESGAWFACDDTHVTAVPSPAAAVTPNAYVLFYQRQGAPAKWGGLALPPPASDPPRASSGAGGDASDRDSPQQPPPQPKSPASKPKKPPKR